MSYFCLLYASAPFFSSNRAPCLPLSAVMFLHPVCADLAGKLAMFRRQGLWLMDDGKSSGGKEGRCPKSSGASQVEACRPLQWRKPATEAPLYSCPGFSSGMTLAQQLAVFVPANR